MDLVINNATIPDFNTLTFKKVNIGIKNGIIEKITTNKIDGIKTIDANGNYLTPGLIDCHCHIESTYLMPSGFGEVIIKHGTLFTVADCHEIANVKGKEGIELFIKDAKNTDAKIKFAVPSCVPATNFATSGGKIDIDDVNYFLKSEEVVALGELMNVPAVVSGEEKFIKMIQLAKNAKKRVNGHAPKLNLKILKQYRQMGVEDDHESYTYQELKQKIELGFFVFLREGSAEKTEDEAYKIIKEYPDRVAFCTDDKSINDILKSGHINYNLKKAIKLGINPILAIKAATYNGLNYYGLDEFSEIKEGKRTYLVLFNKNFDVANVIIDGEIKTDFKHKQPTIKNNFLNTIKVKSPLELPKIKIKNIAIGVTDGSLITEKVKTEILENEFDIDRDFLKLIVIERYGYGRKAACFVKGFGLKRGAMATSIAHDCHNIVAVGTSDHSIKKAIKIIIDNQGAQVVVDTYKTTVMPLKIAGIISDKKPQDVAKDTEKLKEAAKKIGCKLSNPLESLSFMALEVIPHLKLTDRGLFDVDRFEYIR